MVSAFLPPFSSPTRDPWPWLDAAIEYAGAWVDFQMRQSGQPGCVIAIARGNEIVHEQAFGVADIRSDARLTPRARFRTASHSKTFTAVGVLKLAQQHRLQLDEAAGAFIDGLHPGVAAATVRQLLAHGAGLSRDGSNAGYFADLRPFPSAHDLLAELRRPPVLEMQSRAKYSNLGYGLLGLIIEAVTGEPYAAWILREVVAAAGLQETLPDISHGDQAMRVPGHTSRLPDGQRRVIPGDNPTHAMSSVTGFVGTATDLARFFAQLSPDASASVLSRESRLALAAPCHGDPDSASGRRSGLGVFCEKIGGWDGIGNLGRFQGFITRTALLLPVGVTVSVCTNAIDGPAQPWFDGVACILRRFHDGGAPRAELADWRGRWWNVWGAADFVPVGSRVQVFNPGTFPPFTEASEVEVTGPDQGVVARAPMPEFLGEAVSRVRDAQRRVVAIRFGGGGYTAENTLQAQVQARYEAPPH